MMLRALAHSPEAFHLDSLEDALDRALRARASIGGVVRDLMDALGLARAELGDAWPTAIERCRRHPLHAAFFADPLTARARLKPRGYAGDAVMIDYVYRGLPSAERFKVGRFGTALFDATTWSPAAVAVRARRDLLANRIDACAERVKRPRILSLACGHLREGLESVAVDERRIGLLSAIDQDAESIAVVADAFAGIDEVVPQRGSVRDLLRGKIDISRYDLIYAAGLYDYLSRSVATKLTHRLFEGLASGGELLVGNFAPDYPTIGYTEAFMDWYLLCRSEEELVDLTRTIAPAEIAEATTHTDVGGCISYLTLVRA
jgi:extracellular factor (EF) 3-hydroxypalmitic acid methyl ester biosynthesis protein